MLKNKYDFNFVIANNIVLKILDPMNLKFIVIQATVPVVVNVSELYY